MRPLGTREVGEPGGPPEGGLGCDERVAPRLVLDAWGPAAAPVADCATDASTAGAVVPLGAGSLEGGTADGSPLPADPVAGAAAEAAGSSRAVAPVDADPAGTPAAVAGGGSAATAACAPRWVCFHSTAESSPSVRPSAALISRFQPMGARNEGRPS
jgi:hypothetical protein